MDSALRQFVRNRAGSRCEYCLLAQSVLPVGQFHVEHIVARRHGGGDEPENLALSCNRCNWNKGTNLSAIDADSGLVVRLFNPRTDAWDEHFRLDTARIVGRTPIRRATAQLLDMN